MLKIVEAENAKPASVLGYRRKKYFAATGGFCAWGKVFYTKQAFFTYLYTRE